MDTLPCNLLSAFQTVEVALDTETSTSLSTGENPLSPLDTTSVPAFRDSEENPENHTTFHLVFLYMRQCL